MRIIVCLLSFCLLSTSTTFAYTINPESMVNPNVVNSFTAFNSNNNALNYNHISQIEQNLFGRIYVKQPLVNRLDRIERRLFTTTYANLPPGQRVDNIISNYNRLNVNSNISNHTLTRLERNVFNQDYSQNTPQLRIERLEQQVFGAVQSGNLDARAKALEIAARSNGSAARNNVQKRSLGDIIIGGLGNVMNNRGVVTGMSPPINDPLYNNAMYGSRNNQWSNNFNPQDSGYYSGFRSPWGYGDRFSSYGSGASVTILD